MRRLTEQERLDAFWRDRRPPTPVTPPAPVTQQQAHEQLVAWIAQYADVLTGTDKQLGAWIAQYGDVLTGTPVVTKNEGAGE